MSTLKIEERVPVAAPPDKVWQFLLSPKDIVTCLPGAGLDEVVDDRNFVGNIKVKVGPVTVAYKGKATLTEVDEAARKVTMVGEGKEKAGAGKVKMTMNSSVEPTEDGSEVLVNAEVQLAGKVVRFGRGMIQGVSKQVFKEFGDRLRAQLENQAEETAEPKAAAPTAEAAEPAKADAPATTGESEAEDAIADAEPKSADDAEKPASPSGEPEVAAQPAESPADDPPRAFAHDPDGTADTVLPTPAPAEDDTTKTLPPKPAAMTPSPAAPPQKEEAIDGLSLLFKVLWSGIANFFRRLFGRPEKF